MDKILGYLTSGWENFGIYAAAFVLVLGVLVFVHEWGHYIVAKMCGVRVTTFSIGFGKELFGFHDKSGTRWRIAAIPLGGYVQMFGDADPSSATQDDEATEQMSNEDKAAAFHYKKLWQKSLIVFAGPAINFIFAVLLLFGLYVTAGQPVTPPIATAVVADSPASGAGLQPYDIITDINGVEINRFEDIQREVMVALDTKLIVTVDRDGEALVFDDIYPKKIEGEDRFGFKYSRGILGLVGPARGINLEQVTKVNGQDIDSVDAIKAILYANIGQRVTLSVPKLDDEDTVMIVEPERAFLDASFEDEDSAILSLFDPEESQSFIKHGPVAAFNNAMAETASIVSNTFEALGQIVMGSRSAQELGGIVRIGAIAGDAAQAGWIALITFTALLSINLGLINLFPIPVLDGGHLVFYAIEAVKGSPLSERAQEYSYRFGLGVLICLMLFTNLNDIVQIVL